MESNKPIGQTFLVNTPNLQGTYITRIDVYFQSVDPSHGIEMQIRTTNNGQPTPNRLPFASKMVLPNDTVDGHPVLRASTNASVASSFIFDTPVFVENGKVYAFVLLPAGGVPTYNIFTAEIGGTDLTTGVPIYTNNESGDLFLSSNDIAWQPVINEDIKYTIYTAQFTSQTGAAYFTTPDEDWIQFKDPSGDFLVRETLAFGNGYHNIAVLDISGISGTISSGDTVYQTSGSANVSGTVYFANTSVVKIANTTGAFVITSGGTPLLYDATTSGNASVTAVSQNVYATASSNTLLVPDSSVFSVNNVIYLQTSNRSYSQVVKVTALPSNTSIQVNNAIAFTDTNALYGRVIADGTLSGVYSGAVYLGDRYYGVLDTVNATGALNNANNKNIQMIGLSTGVSAVLTTVHNPAYNSLTTQFSTMAPSNTYLNWSFKGFANDGNKTPDSQFISIRDGSINEFIDTERLAMSRSSEFADLPVYRAGNNSITLKVDMYAENAKISPVIDTMQTNITLTYNIIPKEYELKGCYLSINNNSGTFNVGDRVSQSSYGNTTTGLIHNANTSYIMVTNVSGKFISNTAFSTNNSVTGFVQTAEKFDEANNNGYYKASRYMSKNVILAAGQDSEDIRAFIAAYRPANTNILVYAKIQNSIDNEPFNDKSWSKLAELSPASLQSSKVNIDDQVELIYSFPTSQNIFLSNTVTDNTSTTVTCQDTSRLSNNVYIYLQDDTSAKTFNVREVVYVTNSTAFVVDRVPSFTNSNASMGIIPEVQSTTSAFLYDQNSNIVRYVTSADAVYDSYIQFAMKIVPIADSTALVPRVGDMRVLALQV